MEVGHGEVSIQMITAQVKDMKVIAMQYKVLNFTEKKTYISI